jgi:hypothetical protein
LGGDHGKAEKASKANEKASKTAHKQQGCARYDAKSIEIRGTTSKKAGRQSSAYRGSKDYAKKAATHEIAES